MNNITFTVSNHNGFSIELLIDGVIISKLFDSQGDSGIPFWNFEDHLPYFPPNKNFVKDFSRRILSVCSCGEYGCGNINCKIIEKEGIIELSDFKGVKSELKKLIFTFNKKEFDITIQQILLQNAKYKSGPKNEE